MQKFPLINVDKPELFEDIFQYDRVPKVVFDPEYLPMAIPADYWITCTTFRDGQQSRPPYTVEQIVDLYTLMHRLGGEKGVIRQCEFFLYSDKDKKAVEECQKLGYRFPEITGWIRAKKEDFKLVKQMGLKETGILTSASDYHIFLKLNKTRKQAMDSYLEVVRAALEEGIIPRCHLEDLTRADFYGFIIPFVQELMRLSEESKIPIKVRACDTMGYGLPFPNAALPRGVPKLIHGLIHDGGVPSERLEWHGHNDFHKVIVNAEVAWLYGCSAANGTLIGFGERTGNPPIEGLIMEYIALKGGFNGVDPTVITEIGDYFRQKINTVIPPNYPFIGEEFNVTRAGIHADGGLKDERIYNIFNTAKILNRPMGFGVTDKSGAAGIAIWINNTFRLKGGEAVAKQDPGIQKIEQWVKSEYEEKQRITSISNEEMMTMAKRYFPNLFHSELEVLKSKANKIADPIVLEVVQAPEILSLEPARQEAYLQQVAENYPFINLIYITDQTGKKITKNITQKRYQALYQEKFQEFGDFSDRPWFLEARKQRKTYFSDLYTSKVTGVLCMTVSRPILNPANEVLGVLGIDIKFEDLTKL